MIEHMRERNAMQDGPGDPKKKYTTKDSADYYGMIERQQEDIVEYSKPKHWKKGFPSTEAHVINARMSLRSDSMNKNPYGNRVKRTK